MVWKVRFREVTLSVTVVSLLAVIPYLSTLHSYFLGDDFGLVVVFAKGVGALSSCMSSRRSWF